MVVLAGMAWWNAPAWGQDEDVAGPGTVAALRQATSLCRAEATDLRRLADECRQFVNEKEGNTCDVKIPLPNGAVRSLSIAEADAYAVKFDGISNKYDAVLPDVERMEKQIIQDQRAFRVLKIVKSADDFVAWEQLASEAQQEFVQHSLRTIVSLGVTQALQQLDKINLNKAKANELIRELKAKGFDDEELFEHILKLGRSKSRKAKVEHSKAMFERIGMLNDAGGLVDERGLKLLAQATATVLSMTIKDPRLQVLIIEFDWTVQAVYTASASLVAEANIERLNEMTEKDLESVKSLTKVLKKHTDELVSYLKQLPKCEY